MQYASLKRFLFGAPIDSAQEHHERLNIPLALAVFAADALSSTAYATEEILIALVASLAAAQAGAVSLPVALSIGLLIVVVVTSYRQVIRAYPAGGGAYLVAKENLGIMPCLIAGAALMMDYILTVAVSISAGVAALTSTGWVPHSMAVTLALLFVFVIIFVNLRGVRESGAVIAIPAYIFIGSMFSTLFLGLWKVWAPGPLAVESLRPVSLTADLGSIPLDWMFVLLFLKAFSHGCSALTGIEAISNGVKAFKEPAPVNANRTMVIMGCLLGSIFIGMTYLAYQFHVVPSHTETVISQIARQVFGTGSWMYFVVQISTMVILVLAANTSFAGFPRLASLMAYDGFMPRQLMNLGDRLVFSNGITLLGIVSAFLIWLYQADTHALIPLYAVGVFLSFTIAQSGMVVHHRRERESGWRWGIVINSIGAVITGVVTVLLAVEKFTEGAWIVLIAIPALIWGFLQIYFHYKSVRKQLFLPLEGEYVPVHREHRVLVLVSSINRGTIPALEYARAISSKIEALHVELNPEATENFKKAWENWGSGIPLVVLPSPYRSITEPILDYINEVEAQDPNDFVTILVPEFVTKKAWHNLLHNQTALMIKTLLRFRKGKVVTTVRYYLEE